LKPSRGRDHRIQFGDVVGASVDRRLADDLGFDDSATLEGIVEIGLRKRQEEIERGEQGTRLQIGNVGAPAMA